MSEQLSFPFDGNERAAVSGVDLWREQRQLALERLGSVHGLAIGHAVRVTLHSGPIVEGRLLLCDEGLWLEATRLNSTRLRVGNVDFAAAEVASCVRLD
jgi:hypothetical protein